jgi:hypothetical protein
MVVVTVVVCVDVAVVVCVDVAVDVAVVPTTTVTLQLNSRHVKSGLAAASSDEDGLNGYLT